MGGGGWYSCDHPAGQPLASLPSRHQKLQVNIIMHCKETVPKIRNKYSQNRICTVSAQFPHTCLWANLYIPTIGLPVYSAAGKYVDRSWEYIYISLTDTWMWWKLGLRPRSCFSWNTLMGFSLQCGCCSYRTKSIAPVSSCTLIQVCMMEKLLQLTVNFPAV